MTPPPDDEDDHGPPSRHRALIGLLLLVALIAGVLFVVHELQVSARIQDCFASGRTNCAPIDATGRR